MTEAEKNSKTQPKTQTSKAPHYPSYALLGLYSVVLLLVLLYGWLSTRPPSTHISSSQQNTQHDQFARVRQARDKLDRQLKIEADARRQVARSTPVIQAKPDHHRPCFPVQPDSTKVIINKKHCFAPLDWSPTDLQMVEPGHMLRAEAAAHYRAMQHAATEAGAGFSISSSYRSYGDQVTTYNYWVDQSGKEVADRVSARPGFSEHQTGLVVDLRVDTCYLQCFAGTPAYAWLKRNAARYGFIQRYPTNLYHITGYDTEQWHWRYVGRHIAQDMQRKGIQTLEVYFNVAGGNYV